MQMTKKKIYTKPKTRNIPELGTRGDTKKAYIEPQGPIEYVPRGKTSKPIEGDSEEIEPPSLKLRTMDKLGNPVSGHFCPFNLVKTFPYKYMVDSNDRVSRHFFANNKFFERTWDL